MASVYLAHDVQLEQDFALKVISAQLANDPTFVARFRREGRLLARLSHPHILRFYVSGEEQTSELYYLVLEYLTGGTLRERLGTLRWRREDATDLLRPVADALDYAHSRPEPVIHRDLKPANIMFDDQGRPIVADFGLARLITPNDPDSSGPQNLSLTANQIIGTPAYMSPEQAEGLPTSASADVYALAVIAYQLLVGDVPFRAETAFGTLARVISQPVPPPSRGNPLIGPELEQALLRGLAKTPNERFASAGAFVDAIANAPAGKAETRHVWGRPAARVESAVPETPRPEPVDVLPTTLVSAPTDPDSRPLARLVARAGGAGRRLALAGSGFVLVALAAGIFWQTASRSADVAAPQFSPVLNPTEGPVARATAPLAAAPIVTVAAPTVAPTSPPPTRGPVVTSTPAAVDTWQALQPQLDATWGTDWPKTTTLLEAFLKQFPTYVPAQAKFHDALLSYANDLIDAGRPSDGLVQVQRALLATPNRPGDAPAPSADDVWQTLKPILDGVWGTDWLKTTALLDAFLQRFPGHPVGTATQYAALTSYAQDRVDVGASSEAVALLVRARLLQPDRPEAPAALAALTPTPTALPTTVPVMLPPPPARVAPTARPFVPPPPVIVVPPPEPAPAPTKCPFGTPGCGV